MNVPILIMWEKTMFSGTLTNRWARRVLIRLAAVVSLAIVLVMSNTAAAQTDGWGVPVNISDTIGFSWLEAIAIDAYGNVHVIWSEYLDRQEPEGWGDAIYHTMWNGTSWSKAMDVLLSPDPWDKQGFCTNTEL